MEEQAKIKIIGKNIDSGDIIDFFSLGTISFENKTIVIEYDKDAKSQIYKTKITVGDGVVMVSKVGDTTYSMIFEKDKVNSSTITIEYGVLDVDIVTKNVNISQTEHCLDIDVKYTINLGDKLLSNNQYIINVKF